MTTSLTPDNSSDFARFASALAGQYELECEIGRGGMGIVYRARDLRLDRRVAIKTLPPHLANDSIVRERFLREARTAASLSHQNIVPIHRADELGGHVFFVMGYVDGDSLAQRIRDTGPLPPTDVVRYLRDVADALGYAHSRGIIHRDVKAENILLDRASGRALVTDFGIARLAEAAPLTATGQILGTVYYLSPEQISGDPVDLRSDLYSLGVVGFHALTARFPFDGELASAVLIAHVNKAAPSLSHIAPTTPRALAAIVDRCLAKSPSSRFQSCEELLAALTSANVAASAPAYVRDTEAHRIIGRAADLQANSDATRTTGFTRTEIREAAAEAGIPEKFVERAIAERSAINQPYSADVTVPAAAGAVDHTSRHHPVAGAPTQLEFEAVLDGELPAEDFDLLVEIIRRSAGESGDLTTLGRSFSWQSHPAKGNVNVSVLPRAGKTRIRVSESVRAGAVGLFGGIVGGMSGAGIPVWMGVAFRTHDFGFAAAMWAGTALSSYLIARGFFRWHSQDRERRLRKLLDRLTEQAKESIAYTTSRARADS